MFWSLLANLRKNMVNRSWSNTVLMAAIHVELRAQPRSRTVKQKATAAGLRSTNSLYMQKNMPNLHTWVPWGGLMRSRLSASRKCWVLAQNFEVIVHPITSKGSNNNVRWPGPHKLTCISNCINMHNALFVFCAMTTLFAAAWVNKHKHKKDYAL